MKGKIAVSDWKSPKPPKEALYWFDHAAVKVEVLVFGTKKPHAFSYDNGHGPRIFIRGKGRALVVHHLVFEEKINDPGHWQFSVVGDEANALLGFKRFSDLAENPESKAIAHEIYLVEKGEKPLIEGAEMTGVLHCDQMKMMFESLLGDELPIQHHPISARVSAEHKFPMLLH